LILIGLLTGLVVVSKGNVYSEQNQANGDTVAIMLPYAQYWLGGRCCLPWFAGV